MIRATDEHLDAPAPDVLPALHDRLKQLRQERAHSVEDFTSQVRSVLVIASSSRGGSSMLTETLRASQDLLHLQAEINPFLRLVDLVHPASGTGSDRLDARHLDSLVPAARQLLDQELACDAGTASAETDPEQLALDVAWRLTVQWPHLPIDPLEIAAQSRKLLGRVPTPDPGEVTLSTLRHLHRQGLAVSPWYYDLPRDLLRREGFGAPSPQAPGPVLVEEPPFVLARPWRRATPPTCASAPW